MRRLPKFVNERKVLFPRGLYLLPYNSRAFVAKHPGRGIVL